MFKRLFAVLLSLTIMLSFTPAMAFAEDDNETSEGERWGGYRWEYEIEENTVENVEIDDPYDYYSFEFTPASSGWYIFKATGGFDTYGRVMDSLSAEDPIAYDDDNGDGTNFSVLFNASAGETYYLQASMYGSETGDFSVELKKDESDEEEVDVAMWGGYRWEYEIEENTVEAVEIEDPFDYYSFEFTPTYTGWYIFKSTGEYDTYGRVMDSLYADEPIEYNDDSGDSGNFSILFKAESGKTYYLQASMFTSATGNFRVELTEDESDEEDEDDPGRWGGFVWPGTIEAGDKETVEIEDPRDYYSFEFVPTTSGRYIFRSTGKEDTYGRILDYYDDLIDENDDVLDGDPDNYNFSIRFYAEKGESYYLQACMYGSNTGTFNVELVKDNPISIAKATVTNIVTKNYTGKRITQSPIVKVNGVTLRNGVDYTLTYVNNINPGDAYVVIKGQGDYTGSINRAFTIRPVVPGLKLSKVTKGSKSFTAKWSKASSAVQKQFTGYQIQYSTSKYFLSSKTKNTTIKSAKKVIVRKLKKKKTYYVRIRRYLRWRGQIIYSSWSPTKKVKTK